MRIKYKGWEFHAGLTHSQQMIGVNSKLEDGKHFIMWDFDNTELDKLSTILHMMQQAYTLSNIYIMSTGTPTHYHAYCFNKVSWNRLVGILLNTPLLDTGFLKVGFLRGYYTLRISPKQGREVKLVSVLASNVPETVTPTEIPEVIKYWTKRV